MSHQFPTRGQVNQGHAGDDLVAPPLQPADHAGRLGRAARLAEHQAVSHHNGISRQDQPVRVAAGDIPRLGQRQGAGLLHRGQQTDINAIFDVTWNRFVGQTDLIQQLPPAGRGRGEDQHDSQTPYLRRIRNSAMAMPMAAPRLT